VALEVRSRFAAEVFAGSGVQEPPDVEAERREEMELVRATLVELPEDARSMVLLHFYQGLRYKEVAEILDVPVGTVKSRVHWAVEKLCRAWNEGMASVASAVDDAGAKAGSDTRRSRR
jgi:RNA polymerase sigma factor (sigma-70 family)